MATTKAIATGTVTTIAATGVVGYGVSQVVANSNEETPNSNSEREVVTSEKITNRKKITDSKFVLPATDKTGCQDRLNGIFTEENSDYKQIVKDCISKVTFKGRANSFPFDTNPNRKQNFDTIEANLENFSKLKEELIKAKDSNTPKKVNYQVIQKFCHQVGKISHESFETVSILENSWAKYLEICASGVKKSFWTIN